MMIGIINSLSSLLQGFEQSGEAGFGGIGNLQGVLSILDITDIIPGYQFQIVIGLFVVEIGIVLSVLSSGIENGIDKVTQRYTIAKNLFISAGLYFIISLVSILVFSVLAGGITTVASATGG